MPKTHEVAAIGSSQTLCALLAQSQITTGTASAMPPASPMADPIAVFAGAADSAEAEPRTGTLE
jgi:hypothetical protein